VLLLLVRLYPKSYFSASVHVLWYVFTVFCVVWQSEELLFALLPVWEKVYCQEPEAAPFRIPVEPISMGIPVRYFYYSLVLISVFSSVTVLQ
jgi:hypothetical protein